MNSIVTFHVPPEPTVDHRSPGPSGGGGGLGAGGGGEGDGDGGLNPPPQAQHISFEVKSPSS